MLEDSLNDFPVDAVLMWVDGNDVEWQKKINEFSNVKINFQEKKESVRYNSIGEVNIAIRSIIKFAPFIRNLFLVTDEQTPNMFSELKELASQKNINLKRIDHKVIFRDYEEYLPCFNSRSIATVLYRIPDLSEHFIIFNDDTFLMRDTSIKDYFNAGLPVLRGKWKTFYEDQKFRQLYYKLLSLIGKNHKKNKVGFKEAMQKSAKLAGVNKYIRRFHNPIPTRRSTIESFFNKNDELLRNNIKYRFRNNKQFLVESLANHLEVKNGTFVYDKETRLTYFRSYKRPKEVRKKLSKFLKTNADLFMTFQSLELADKEIRNYILNWIYARIE